MMKVLVKSKWLILTVTAVGVFAVLTPAWAQQLPDLQRGELRIGSDVEVVGDSKRVGKAVESGQLQLTGSSPQGPLELQAISGELPVSDDATQLRLGRVSEDIWGVNFAETDREIFWQELKDNLAGSFRIMLRNFTKQFAYDTATWIASGGKGQEPLFITEGIGAYLRNTADAALGGFLDELASRYNIDICEPSFNVKVLIPSLLGERPRGGASTVSCRFSDMVSNWQSAIDDAEFVVEYQRYLNPGENDLGTLLTIQTDFLQKQQRDLRDAALEVLANDQWKSLKDYAGWVLTPGTMIREKWGISEQEASEADKLYTGTIWDFIETFINTLVGQLLNNLMTGFFDSGTDSNDPFRLPNIPGLFNYESQPYSEGRSGAAGRFANLLRVGEGSAVGSYDIIAKLLQCTDKNKTNPGPTDCVLDQSLADGIRQMKLVKNLGDNIKNRRFIPSINEVTPPEEAFTLRNVMIMRKYRIVPVGWEIAAKYIDEYQRNVGSSGNIDSYTLKDLMDSFDDGNPVSWAKGLIDPNWVLKAPALYCRRQGAGEHNQLAEAQDNQIRRSDYCADEQQCIREDDDGNCLSYGYCTEERRDWNFGGDSCQPIDNTCQSFVGSDRQSVSYLKNTLDFRDCDKDVVGCQWYSTIFDPQANIWTHTAEDSTLKKCNNPDGCIARGRLVQQWRTINIDSLGGVIMDEQCSNLDGCDYASVNCRVSFGGYSCRAVDGDDNSLNATLVLGKELAVNQAMYFDADAQNCDAAQEGCSVFVRTAAGLGSNMVVNGSFENDDGWGGTSFTTTTRSHSGNRSVGLSGGNFVLSDTDTISLIKGKKYILSAWVNATTEISNNDQIQISINSINADSQVSNVLESINLSVAENQVNNWQLGYKAFIADNNYFNVNVGLFVRGGYDGQVYIDDIKLEQVYYNVQSPSGYTPYDINSRPASQLANLKKAPDYYGCYLTDAGVWPTTEAQLGDVLDQRSAACANFALVCTPNEVGCELYMPKNGDPGIPGIIASDDVCPAACVGYQVYHQDKTDFSRDKFVQFIADDSPQYCSAAYAGCDEFTNLDTVAQGGEGLEYYQHLRVCQKEAGQTYYTWEGSDTTGYQLKVYNLKLSEWLTNENNSGISGYAPCTNLTYDANGDNQCRDKNQIETVVEGISGNSSLNNYYSLIRQETISNASLVDARALRDLHDVGLCLPQEMTGYVGYDSDDNSIIIPQNSNCRQFYDTSGNTYYRLLSKVIYSSQDCHPYRRTMTQSSTFDAQQDCSNSGGYWNSNSECVYMAIPGQGTSCPAAAAGCRSYAGNQANNVRQLFRDDFETGTGNWQYGVLSSISSYPGGTSLTNRGSLQLTKTVNIQTRKSYILSFWAKGDSAFNLNSIRFNDAPSDSDWFAKSTTNQGQINISDVAITTDWRYYELGPVFVTWIGGDKTLEINILAGQNIYLDNINLKETTENVYAVENSWTVPLACDNALTTPYGPGGISNPSRALPGEMIGCQAYSDRAGQAWNLRSFDQLCRAEAVGCEALIDTYNSESPLEQTVKNVTTPADQMIYLVNDKKHSCDSGALGCTAYGLPSISRYDEVLDYATVYKQNLPDRYGLDLCESQNLWCDAYTAISDQSTYYFKNPGNKLCEYKTLTGQTNAGWYRKGTTEPCDTTNFQTIGTGVAAEKRQPIGWYDNLDQDENDNYNGWAGLCAPSQDSCTEYIDPLTNIYSNLLVNGDFSQNYLGGSCPDGWSSCTSYIEDSLTGASQNISLISHTLYSLSAINATAGDINITLTCPLGTDLWSPDGSMTVNVNSASLSRANLPIPASGSESAVSGRIYVAGSTAQVACTLELSGNAGAARVSEIKLVEAGVYYYLKDTVDYNSCNGLIDYNNGCVPLNDRSEIDYSQGPDPFSSREIGYLTIDADATYNNQINNQSNPGQEAVNPLAATIFGQNNSNKIIKVQPDRSCYSWLYCTTYEKQSESASYLYGDLDRCLDIGLCTSVDEKGVCNRPVTPPTVPQAEMYDSSFANKTGYAKVGIEAISPVYYQVAGYYPFNEMPQIGASASVVNGNFELIFGGQAEPLGWMNAATTTIKRVENIDPFGIFTRTYESEGELPPEWNAEQFTVVTSKLAPEGLGYLKLNGNHAPWITATDGQNQMREGVVSEEIDVISGKEYILSFWVSTMGLQKTPNAGEPSADLLIVYDNNKILRYDGNLVQATIPAGLDWQMKSLRFVVPVDIQSVKVAMKNFNVSGGSYSLWDNIDLKPNLAATGDVLISRTCRVYPETDSRSCSYYRDGNYYYGNYGYCLMTDPLNPKQCLQWWPVDQIKGELVEEFSGYGDRMPLYYCIEDKSVEIDISRFGYLAQVNSQRVRGSDYEFLLDLQTDRGVNFIPFSVPEEFGIFMRHPYIKGGKFDFEGAVIGSADEASLPVFWPLIASMYRKAVLINGVYFIGDGSSISDDDDNVQSAFNFINRQLGEVTSWIINLITEGINFVQNLLDDLLKVFGIDIPKYQALTFKVPEDIWGGWSVSGVGGTILGNKFYFGLPYPWHKNVDNPTFQLLSSISSILNLIGVDDIADLQWAKMGAKVVTDQDSGLGNSVKDPFPDIKGDILGLAWFLEYSGRDADALGIIGSVSAEIRTTYCSKIVQVVTSGGQNRAWLDRINDPNYEWGNSTEKYLRDNPFDFEDFYQAADGLKEDQDIQALDYFPSDYKPYGSLVAPTNAQNPENWDSKQTIGYRQPLFNEPPRVKLQPPYQARSGAIHNPDYLSNMFIRTYGVWTWDELNDNPENVDGYYRRLSQTESDSFAKYDYDCITQWGETGGYCAGGTRPSPSSDLSGNPCDNVCRIRPQIENLTMEQVDANGLFKFSFTVNVDANQLPITSYVIDWGDEETVVTGVSLKNRINVNNPFIFYHAYDKWDLQRDPAVDCTSSACDINVKVTVIDNWGAEQTAATSTSLQL